MSKEKLTFAVDFDGCLWIYRELYVNRLTADKLGQMIMEVEDCRYKLFVVGVGIYEANSLSELIWIVIKHRFEHLFRGEGFID